ncbi:MAG: hypothetical protein NVV57_06065 [Demequina sp.]|nr:hypothetical protein [Demequina sp.]
MSLDYLVAPVAILSVIAAITLVSFGVSGLRNGRKRQGAWLLAGGILMVVVPVGATAAWNAYREWASWEHTVSVQGLDPTGAPEFAVDIRHQAGYADSSTYNFAEAGDLDSVRAVFQRQHLDGVAADSGPFVEGDLTSAWHVYLSGTRFDLFDAGDGSFTVATQVAWVSRPDASGDAVAIPFPSGSSPAALTPEVTKYATDLTQEQWREFFEPIDGVVFTEMAIAVPTSAGGTATLTFGESDGLRAFTVSLSD